MCVCVCVCVWGHACGVESEVAKPNPCGMVVMAKPKPWSRSPWWRSRRGVPVVVKPWWRSPRRCEAVAVASRGCVKLWLCQAVDVASRGVAMSSRGRQAVVVVAWLRQAMPAQAVAVHAVAWSCKPWPCKPPWCSSRGVAAVAQQPWRSRRGVAVMSWRSWLGRHSVASVA